MPTPPQLPPKPSVSASTPEISKTPEIIASVPAPTILASVPSQDLQAFISSRDLLISYVSTLSASKEITTKQKQRLELCLETLNSFSNKINDDLPKLRSLIESKLYSANNLEIEWRNVEKEMYDALSQFSPSFIKIKLNRSIQELDILTNSLSQSFLNGTYSNDNNNNNNNNTIGSGNGSEQSSLYSTPVQSSMNISNGGDNIAQVNEFIRNYRSQRKEYYKRKEWMTRWNEDRVGGITGI